MFYIKAYLIFINLEQKIKKNLQKPNVSTYSISTKRLTITAGLETEKNKNNESTNTQALSKEKALQLQSFSVDDMLPANLLMANTKAQTQTVSKLFEITKIVKNRKNLKKEENQTSTLLEIETKPSINLYHYNNFSLNDSIGNSISY